MPTNTEQVRDFHTGRPALRRQCRIIAKPCAGCGKQTQHYDAKYGWHVCPDCDSEDIADELVRHVMNPNEGNEGIF